MSENKSGDVNDTICKMVNSMRPSVNTLVDVPTESRKSDSVDRNLLKRPASNIAKDEDVVTPKKFKGNLNMDFEYIDSPREMRRIRSDLLESRNTILNLENRISQMHNLRKEMQVIFDNENQTLKKQQESDRKTILDLEGRLQQIRRREQEAKMELSNVIKIIQTIILYYKDLF